MFGVRVLVIALPLMVASVEAFSGYSYFKTRNPKCRSAMHPDERQRLMDYVNLVRKRLVRRNKAFFFGIVSVPSVSTPPVGS